MMRLALNIRIFNGTGTDIVLTYQNYSVWVWIALHTLEIHVLQSSFKMSLLCKCGWAGVLYVMLCPSCTCSLGLGTNFPLIPLGKQPCQHLHFRHAASQPR